MLPSFLAFMWSPPTLTQLDHMTCFGQKDISNPEAGRDFDKQLYLGLILLGFSWDPAAM